MGNITDICCKSPPALSAPKDAGVAKDQAVENEDATIARARAILARYNNKVEIGQGAFGKVFKMEKDGKKFAMKCIKKSMLKSTKVNVDAIVKEKNIMKQMDSPFIVKLFECFQDSQHVYFIMEFCNGGELLNIIKERAPFSEEAIRIYTVEILLGLQSLHEKSVTHRDLKAENILLDGDGHIKLIDFGLSKVGDNKTESRCGTLIYLSPEMLTNQECGKTIDFWSLGCIIYEMAHQYHPFDYGDQQSVEKNIKLGKFKPFGKISEDLKDLISKLLKVNPKERIGSNGIIDIMNHPFFGKIDWNYAQQKKLKPPYPVKDVSNKIPLRQNATPEIAETTDIIIKDFTDINNSLKTNNLINKLA